VQLSNAHDALSELGIMVTFKKVGSGYERLVTKNVQTTLEHDFFNVFTLNAQKFIQRPIEEESNHKAEIQQNVE
jgi:hypothetical protein